MKTMKLYQGCKKSLNFSEKNRIKPTRIYDSIEERAIKQLKRFESIFDYYLEIKIGEDGADTLNINESRLGKKNIKYLKRVIDSSINLDNGSYTNLESVQKIINPKRNLLKKRILDEECLFLKS